MGQTCAGTEKSFEQILAETEIKPAKRGKVHKAYFPEAPDVPPSQASQQDIQMIKSWPKLGPLSSEDIVVVKGAWNRIIAWKDMLMEAMIYRWVHLDAEVYETLQACFDEVPHDLFQVIDRSVRALDKRTEVHHRESYTVGFPACITRDFGQEPFEILTHFAILGIRPKQWATLKEAFLYAMKTHNPYMYGHDKRDLDLGESGAVARFFDAHVVQEANRAVMQVIEVLQGPAATMVHRQVLAIGSAEGLGELFYKVLLTKCPSLLDFFASTDMKSLATHFEQTLKLLGTSQIGLRDIVGGLRRLGEVHRVAMIPSHTFPPLAEVLVATLNSVVEMDQDLVRMWLFLYVATSRVISLPMAVDERVLEEATEFFEQLAKEENWAHWELEKRLQTVQTELHLTGTYRHTAHELEAGARLAWRNEPKCIGRIAWNTLVVRDCRHARSPSAIFEECKEHLRQATCEENIRSVMSVFAPRRPNEMWGTRFWNSQFVRFAGYKQKDGSILGDPANVDFTEMVMRKFGWMPPTKRGRFDPLPQIIQVAGDEPQMFEFPPELMHHVKLEHPKLRGFARLGLMWCAVPVITNFNMRIGGLNYPCCPFNGWFVDLEISRNLFERYAVGPAVAKVCGVDMGSDSTAWRQACYAHLSCTVTHSFRKAKVSIVDHYTVSNQFLTHIDREMQAGREVPAQWSWIGGFVGVHCPVWGYEMRDFYLRPKFHYCAEKHVVMRSMESMVELSMVKTKTDAENAALYNRRVLILYASETGTAEHFARRIAQELGPGYRPKVVELNAFDEASVASKTHLIFFCSTFNNGTHPRNGSSFPDKLPFHLVRQNGDPIKFAVMALGSTIYPKFCAFGKKVESVVRAAGAKRFVNTVLADETKDQQQSFQQFLAGVQVELPPSHGSADVVPAVLKVSLAGATAPEQPPLVEETYGHKVAKVVSGSELLGSANEHRSTRQIEIDISGTGLEYHTGGHLSVFPCSPEEEVVLLCDALGIPRAQLHSEITAVMEEGESTYPASLHFKPRTLYDMFKWHLDITVRIKNIDGLVKMIYEADGMSQEEYFALLARDKNEVVEEYWWVARILAAHPPCKGKVTLSKLVETLGRQVPRLYSIASSALAHPERVTLCVGLVSAQGAHKGNHHGLCSGYLHRLQPGDTVYVATRQSSFQLPDMPTAPLIMIGAGTGVAPFLAFAQERKKLKARGEAQLYFGCRNSQEVLGQSTLNDAKAMGAISRYTVAFSREAGVEKTYVSDVIAQSWSDVWKAIQDPTCHCYVCGDGNMASSAEHALVRCIQASGMSRAKAVQFLENMRVHGRYHLDIWGIVTRFQAGLKKDPKKINLAQQWLNNVIGGEDDFRLDE